MTKKNVTVVAFPGTEEMGKAAAAEILPVIKWLRDHRASLGRKEKAALLGNYVHPS